MASRLAEGRKQLPVQWVLRAVSPGAERQGHSVDSPPSDVDVTNGGAISLLPRTSLWRGA
jgi:hypothetical protein